MTPHKQSIVDNFGRTVNYLRLAVTDRCNLRCFYCMQEEQVKFAPRSELLSYEEMERLIRILTNLGINKLRLTGGEPFVRRGLISFIERISRFDGLDRISITTNGTVTKDLVPQFADLKIRSVNLSLDSMDAERFKLITRRDALSDVLSTLDRLLEYGIDTKTNTVVMEGRNTQDIVPMAMLSKDAPVTVRFIEEMPFNGEGQHPGTLTWNHERILAELKNTWPDIMKISDPPFSTAQHYQIPGFTGKIGIIAAYSRTFCGTCNRLRITPKGMLQTCLYDGGVLDLKTIMRDGADNEALTQLFVEQIGNRARDGFAAEARRENGPARESMTTIGG